MFAIVGAGRAVRALIAAVFAVAVSAGIGAGTAAPGTEKAVQQNADLLYVCVQDDAKIAVIDMKARALLRTIDLAALGFPATAKPHYVAVEPDGSAWYVSLIGANQVVKFDRNDRIVGRFEMGTPGMLGLAVGSDALVVSRSMSAVNPPSRVAVIRRSSMQGDELDVLFPRPHPIAVTSAGYAYTGSLGVNQLAAISLEDDKVELTTVAGPQHSLVQFAVSPDGRTLVGSTDLSGRLLVFDLASPAKPTLKASVQLDPMAFDPVFTPDGRFVYVPVKSKNDIAVVETAGWTVVSRISDPSFHEPHQIVFSSDGTTAFVTNNRKMDHMADPAMAGHDMSSMGGAAGDEIAQLSIMDVATRKVVKAIPLGHNLTGMGTRARR